jgi:hypothetical protein
VTIILTALVTASWVVIPTTTIDAVGSVVPLVASMLGAILARSRVTPPQGGM